VTYCPTEALQYKNRDYTVEELVGIALQDKDYYENSGGGVTLSGGEPMLQADFIAKLLKAFKEHGVHTAVDTAANVPFSEFEKVMAYTDLFLVDIKAMNPDVHRKYTGVRNDLILKNIQALSERGGQITIRMPIVKDVNDDLENVREAAEFLSGPKGIKDVQLLPYHNYGIYKGLSVGIQKKEFAPPQNLDDLVKEFEMHGIRAEV